MSLVITTNPITTAGTKQFGGDKPITFTGYQVKDTLLNNKLYTDNSTAYPATVVGTATITTVSSRFPLSGDLFETVFNPGDAISQVPLVGQQRDYININATATNGGCKFSVAWDMSQDNWFAVVNKSSSTSVAGKVKVRSSASQESVLSFTTSATAQTWKVDLYDFKTNGASGVTFTGTPVFTGITEIEITLDAISTADIALVYGANNYSQIIGSKIAYKHACVSEADLQMTMEISDLLCNQQVEQRTGSGRNVQFTIGSKKKDLEAQAFAMGDVLRRKLGYFIELLNDQNVGGKAVAAGTITLPASQNIALVEIDGVGTLKPYHSATNVPVGAYHYTGTTLTVNTLYNGKIPTIYIWNRVSKLTRQVRNLELGYVGFLQVPRKTESGKYEYVTSTKAQVSLEAEGFNDDFDQVNFLYSVYPKNGVYVEIAND
jgi:hypothetical protein